MSSNNRHAETAGRDLKRLFDSDHAANRLLSLALAISFIINACRRADIDSSTATQTGGSPASPLPTEFDGTPVLVASPPTGEVISSATPLPATETPLPILTPTATPDLRIQSVSIETARSFLGVALPAASEALVSAASNTPYLADVYSETFLSQQLDNGSLSPETRSLYQDLLAQITQMRAAKGVGSLCGPDSLVFHNGRFGSYFRAMPLCITPDGSSMVWLQGFDGRLSSHASIAQGIDASRYSWGQLSLEGVRPEEIAAVVNRGNFTVAAKDETKGGEILSKAYVTAEKQWVESAQFSITFDVEIIMNKAEFMTPKHVYANEVSESDTTAGMIMAGFYGASIAGGRIDDNGLLLLITWKGSIFKIRPDNFSLSKITGYNDYGPIRSSRNINAHSLSSDDIRDVIEGLQTLASSSTIKGEAGIAMGTKTTAQTSGICDEAIIPWIAQQCRLIPEEWSVKDYQDLTARINSYLTVPIDEEMFSPHAVPWWKNPAIPEFPSELVTFVGVGGLD